MFIFVIETQNHGIFDQIMSLLNRDFCFGFQYSKLQV